MKDFPIKINLDFQGNEIFRVLGRKIYKFETAIKIVRLMKWENAQLSQNINGSVTEWDNF